MCSSSCCSKSHLCECHFGNTWYLRHPCASPHYLSSSSSLSKRLLSCRNWKVNLALSSWGCWSGLCYWHAYFWLGKRTIAYVPKCWCHLTSTSCIQRLKPSEKGKDCRFQIATQIRVFCPRDLSVYRSDCQEFAFAPLELHGARHFLGSGLDTCLSRRLNIGAWKLETSSLGCLDEKMHLSD